MVWLFWGHHSPVRILSCLFLLATLISLLTPHWARLEWRHHSGWDGKVGSLGAHGLQQLPRLCTWLAASSVCALERRCSRDSSFLLFCRSPALSVFLELYFYWYFHCVMWKKSFTCLVSLFCILSSFAFGLWVSLAVKFVIFGDHEWLDLVCFWSTFAGSYDFGGW